MGLGTARTTSTHTHTSYPQFSQPRYPTTFGLGILFWCLGSPAPRGIAEPTIAALCPKACPKNLCSPPPSSLLAPKQSPPERLSTLRGEALHPSLHKTLPFTFSFFFVSQSGHLFAPQPQRRGHGSRGSTHPHPRVLEPARSALQELTFSFLSPSFPWFQGFSSSLNP